MVFAFLLAVIIGTGRSDLQRAVDTSTPGQVIELPLNSTYGPLVLPGRRLDITIQPVGVEKDLAGMRRLPKSYGAPRIESETSERPLSSRFRTAGVIIRAVRIVSTRPVATPDPSPIVEFGRGDNYAAPTSADDLPRDITLDRCDIFPVNETASVGVIANAENLTLTGCRITNIVWKKKDTQGVIATYSRGPLMIRDCDIQAAGECIIMGGDPCIILGLRVMERGLEVSYCDISKPLAWRDRADIAVKNLLELKHCWKANIHHNAFRNNWASAQSGEAIVFTPREENPSRYSVSRNGDVTQPVTRSVPAPQAAVWNVDFHDNVIDRVDCGFRVSSDDDISCSTDIALLRHFSANEAALTDVEKKEYARLKSDGGRGVLGTGRIHIHGNTVTNVGVFGGPGRMFQIAGANPAKLIRELTVENNTLIHSSDQNARRNSVMFFEGVPANVGRLSFVGNTYTHGEYGVFATGGKRGDETRDWYVESEWKQNTCLDGDVESDKMPKGYR